MWHDLFAVEIPALEKVLRTVLIYAVVFSRCSASPASELHELSPLVLSRSGRCG